MAILPDLGSQLVVDRRRRGLLDQLLMTALDRAVAFAEVDDVAVLVGEHLDLDVARVGEIALEVDGRVREELLALARGALERVLELVLGQRDAESLAATATRRLDRDRVADRLLDHPFGVIERVDRLRRSRDDGDVCLGHQLAGARLRAHRLDSARRRPDERDPELFEPRGEVRVLGQEAVAGVDSVGVRLLDDLEQLVDVEIALGGGPRPEQIRLVSPLDVDRVAVELGVDGDSGDAELLARADDSYRDLAAVGDQDLREHAAGTLAGVPPAAAPPEGKGVERAPSPPWKTCAARQCRLRWRGLSCYA